MASEVIVPDFGDQAYIDASLSTMVRSLRGSSVLKIATDIRALVNAGHSVLNLTVGDFNPKYFPIPEKLRQEIEKALAAGATNYPPPPGIPALRQAVSGYIERACGVRYPVDSILITCGGRPIIYATYYAIVSPGDTVVYSVPSWQNEHYVYMTGAKEVVIKAKSENGFQPTLAEIAPHLQTARLICLCSPNNPTGTVIDPEALREILEAVVKENARRRSTGNERALFVMYDQIYCGIRTRDDKHRYTTAVVPESAPYVISVDGLSKAFAATGVRVGWLTAPPAIAKKMGELLSHIGAWAPHAEQVATAAFLNDAGAINKYRADIDDKIYARLEAVYNGFMAMQKDGFSVSCIAPDGAIYVSVQIKISGKTNEEIRTLLLEKAGVAIIPFQAFGLEDDTGWFRVSVGAVSMEDISEMFPRLRTLLSEVA
jgi:aspartate aminotransferase